jgi:hypothetical protein
MKTIVLNFKAHFDCSGILKESRCLRVSKVNKKPLKTIEYKDPLSGTLPLISLTETGYAVITELTFAHYFLSITLLTKP